MTHESCSHCGDAQSGCTSPPPGRASVSNPSTTCCLHAPSTCQVSLQNCHLEILPRFLILYQEGSYESNLPMEMSVLKTLLFRQVPMAHSCSPGSGCSTGWPHRATWRPGSEWKPTALCIPLQARLHSAQTHGHNWFCQSMLPPSLSINFQASCRGEEHPQHQHRWTGAKPMFPSFSVHTAQPRVPASLAAQSGRWWSSGKCHASSSHGDSFHLGPAIPSWEAVIPTATGKSHTGNERVVALLASEWPHGREWLPTRTLVQECHMRNTLLGLQATAMLLTCSQPKSYPLSDHLPTKSSSLLMYVSRPSTCLHCSFKNVMKWLFVELCFFIWVFLWEL